MGAPDRLLARLGEAEVAHLSLSYELRHRAEHVLDRNVGVDAMLVQEIDTICRETPQRAFDRFANVRRPAVDASNGAILVEAEAELGRDDQALALALQRASQQFFVFVRP